MAWRIEYDDGADKDLAKLDRPVAQRILKFLGQRVAALENPRSLGEALKGSQLGDFWKYHVGDYRIIAEIQDKVVCVYVVAIGNRKQIYR